MSSRGGGGSRQGDADLPTSARSVLLLMIASIRENAAGALVARFSPSARAGKARSRCCANLISSHQPGSHIIAAAKLSYGQLPTQPPIRAIRSRTIAVLAVQ